MGNWKCLISEGGILAVNKVSSFACSGKIVASIVLFLKCLYHAFGGSLLPVKRNFGSRTDVSSFFFYLSAVIYCNYFLVYRKTIFTKLKPRTIFWNVAFVPVISSSRQTTPIFAPFSYFVYFLKYRNHSHQCSNWGQFFRVVAFILVIFSLIQITLILASFSYFS
jgi:hypothetical protein